MRVAFFATCLGDQFFADACADAVRLLRHLGVAVEFPEGQVCCGQPAYNSGHRADARRMARSTSAVFDAYDHVVLPSGSCAGMMRCLYPELLGPEGAGHDRPIARTASGRAVSSSDRVGPPPVSQRVWELAEFLVHVVGVQSLGTGLNGRRIAYHHGCHALRELGVEAEPLALLRGCGAEVLEWEADRECCGFGGLFSAKLPEVSAGMADRKLDTLPRVDVVASADGGCLLQLSGRATRRGRDGGAGAPAFRHLASLLWEGVGA